METLVNLFAIILWRISMTRLAINAEATMTRIYDQKTSIKKDAVRGFFERRGENINTRHPLTSVLYQDNNPLLAEMRDAYEKEKVIPLLNVNAQASILDIGCGIGRWADALEGTDISHYHGVDFSTTLIEAAKQRHQNKKFTFQVLAAEDVEPSKLAHQGPFSHLIISGVLLYLNDVELAQALHSARRCAGPNALIYIREPIAVSRRLTLDQYNSVELSSDYSAIYRTDVELQTAFNETLITNGFQMIVNDYLYPEQLNNRAETVQKIFLFASK